MGCRLERIQSLPRAPRSVHSSSRWRAGKHNAGELGYLYTTVLSFDRADCAEGRRGPKNSCRTGLEECICHDQWKAGLDHGAEKGVICDWLGEGGDNSGSPFVMGAKVRGAGHRYANWAQSASVHRKRGELQCSLEARGHLDINRLPQFSSFTSNIIMLRMAQDSSPHANRLW